MNICKNYELSTIFESGKKVVWTYHCPFLLALICYYGHLFLFLFFFFFFFVKFYGYLFHAWRVLI